MLIHVEVKLKLLNVDNYTLNKMANNSPSKRPLLRKNIDIIRFAEDKPKNNDIVIEEPEVEIEPKKIVSHVNVKQAVEQRLMPIALIEAGTTSVMFNDLITNQSHPIEYVGNDEYRVYINGKVNTGRVRNSSPAYFVIPKKECESLERRGIKLAYNSNTEMSDVNSVSYEYMQLEVATSWSDQPGTLNMVTKQPHGLTDGTLIELFDTSIAGIYEVDSSTDTIFSIKLNEEVLNTYTHDHPQFKTFVGSKVYCRMDNLSVGDYVVFDYASGNGKRFRLNSMSKDSRGVFFHISEVIPSTTKKVIKSHSIDSEEDTIEFGYENHLSYYQVSGMDVGSDSLWLTYEPDVLPKGRAGHVVSYIQFFHSDMGDYFKED